MDLKNSNPISVSVIIPCYNSESTISSCLDSIFYQTELPDEIILIDDNSNDKTLSEIELSKEKSPVKIKVVDDNGCESSVGQFAISNSVIILRNFDIQDITCTSDMVVDNSGSISLSVSNSEIPVEFVLFDALDTANSLTETTSSLYDSSITISNPTTDSVIFGMLTARDYIIEVTDANNCATPFEFEATVNTNTADKRAKLPPYLVPIKSGTV